LAALGFDFLTIAIYTIQFLILFAILKVIAYGPISEMLEKRKQAIADGLAAAERAQQDAAQQRAAFEKELADTRNVSHAEAQKAAEATKKMREEIIVAARQEADDIKARAREEAKQERQQIADELRRQTAELAMQITRKVVGDAIDQNAQRKLTEQFLANLGDA
jgi:F-type H+-transporting ATPase subunit b